MSPLLAKFCRQFSAHFYEFYHSLDEVAGLGLRGLTAEEQEAFAPILDELTSERYSDNDLVELWRTLLPASGPRTASKSANCSSSHATRSCSRTTTPIPIIRRPTAPGRGAVIRKISKSSSC